jgi:predicted AlkP superfamily phosphohydrolase/phosphomutase
LNSEEPILLLIIGLDGATFDVLDPLIARGKMPNLARLKEQACWGRLQSTVPPFTAPAWSSFITGMNPGQHGIISFRTRDAYNYSPKGSGFVNAERFDNTLWEILSAAGKTVGVVNVPLTYPPRPINGYLITGMLTPPGARNYTYPLDLADRLSADYIIDLDFIRVGDSFRQRDFPPKLKMMAAIRQMTQTRFRTCARLLQEEDWDFFMVVFTSTDRVSHFFWPYLETLIGGEATGIDPAVLQEVETYFSELDEGIGTLLRQVKPNTTVLIISDHGFGPAQSWRLYVNVWLEQLGLLKRRSAKGPLDLEHWRVLVGRQRFLGPLLRRLVPPSVQNSVSAAARSVSDHIIDWTRTQAFFVPIYFHVCGIEINLIGIHRDGIVQPGNQYQTLRDQIIQHALSLRDPHSGHQLVEIAARREELYHGPFVEQFPDIILVLDPNYLGAPSLAGDVLTGPFLNPSRSGEHRQDGVFIASGPLIAGKGELKGLDLLDVPPTVLYAFGLPIPSTFDGRVVEELFSPAHLSAHPIAVQATRTTCPSSASLETALSDRDETALEERLRGLGYIE